MNSSNPIEHPAQRGDELVSRTGRRLLRMLWHQLRLAISEMSYAVRRLNELQGRLLGAGSHTALPPTANRAN